MSHFLHNQFNFSYIYYLVLVYNFISFISIILSINNFLRFLLLIYYLINQCLIVFNLILIWLLFILFLKFKFILFILNLFSICLPFIGFKNSVHQFIILVQGYNYFDSIPCLKRY